LEIHDRVMQRSWMARPSPAGYPAYLDHPQPPMTVLIDLSPLDTPSRLRGIGQYIIGLTQGIRQLQALGELDIEIDGIAQFDWRGQIARPDGLDYAGTPVHPNGYRWFGYRMRKRLGLERAATRLAASLLHVTEPIAMPQPRRTPIVVTCHDLIPLVLYREYLGAMPWARAWRQRQDLERYSRAARIIAVSSATRSDLVEYLGIDPNKIDVAHLGLDHRRFCPSPNSELERDQLRQKYRLARPFLLYVGAFDARKNIALLVQAFAASGLARDFDLVLGGAMEDAYREPLLALAKSQSVENSARFIGFVDDADLAPLYRACHVHVFPSKYEGFGLPVAEALGCGAPTITTNASSLPEVAGEAAVLVPASEQAALMDAMKSLCYDDARRAELRRAGPLQAMRLNWQQCARKTVESYKRALG
jgi:glycosyltransferase involved in cell wall biosynthesis